MGVFEPLNTTFGRAPVDAQICKSGAPELGKPGVTDSPCCHTGQYRGLEFSCQRDRGNHTPPTGNASRRPN